MGRRKKAAKKVLKKARYNILLLHLIFVTNVVRPTVPTVFKCLYCNHDKAVECTLDLKNKVGDLNCRICGANYQATITCKSISCFQIFYDAVFQI